MKPWGLSGSREGLLPAPTYLSFDRNRHLSMWALGGIQSQLLAPKEKGLPPVSSQGDRDGISTPAHLASVIVSLYQENLGG